MNHMAAGLTSENTSEKRESLRTRQKTPGWRAQPMMSKTVRVAVVDIVDSEVECAPEAIDSR